MSDLSLFYSSMSGVLNQWSDFKTSRKLYKPYFDMQKSNAKSASESAAEKVKSSDTTKKSTTSSSSAVKDKLKTYATNVTTSASKLEKAFEKDEVTGEIDRDKALSAAKDFVNSFNELYSSTRQSGNKSVSSKSEFISNMTGAYARKLENAGISVGSDGKLSINEEEFKNADAADLDKIFGKSNSFASFMSSQGKSLAAYADTSAYTGSTYTKSGSVASASNASAISGLVYNQLF